MLHGEMLPIWVKVQNSLMTWSWAAGLHATLEGKVWLTKASEGQLPDRGSQQVWEPEADSVAGTKVGTEGGRYVLGTLCPLLTLRIYYRLEIESPQIQLG